MIKEWVNGATGWPCWLVNQDNVCNGENPELAAEISLLPREGDGRKGVSVTLGRDRLIVMVWVGQTLSDQPIIELAMQLQEVGINATVNDLFGWLEWK